VVKHPDIDQHKYPLLLNSWSELSLLHSIWK